MATLVRSITISAPAEKAFDYALDIRNLWALPNVGLADVHLKPEGTGSTAKIFTHMLGIHSEARLEYLEAVRPEKIVAKVSGNYPDNPTWTLTFEPTDDGTTFTVKGDWHINLPAVGGPMEDMMARAHHTIVDRLLNNVKDGAEGRSA